MIDPALARRIEATAWSTVLLGLLCMVLAAMQTVMPYLLRRLSASLDPAEDPTRAMRDAWSAGAGTGAAANVAFGVALIVIGVAVARRKRWAHPALTIACWGSIAVLAILAKPTLAPFFALGGGDAAVGKGMLVAAAALILAQLGAVLWFLRFWLRPEVRDAFR